MRSGWLIALVLVACGGDDAAPPLGACARPPPGPPSGSFGVVKSGGYQFSPDGFTSLRGTMTITVSGDSIAGEFDPTDPRDHHRSVAGSVSKGLATLDMLGDVPGVGETPWRVVGQVTPSNTIRGTLGFGGSCPSDHVTITPLP